MDEGTARDTLTLILARKINRDAHEIVGLIEAMIDERTAKLMEELSRRLEEALARP